VSAVPAVSAVPRVLKAVRALLCADATLTARLTAAPAAMGGGPGIYTEGYVPAEARTDYLTIGPFTEVDDSTMGDGAKWGSNVTMQTKLVTQSRDIGYSLGTVDRLMALLHGVPLTVDDYAAAGCQLETGIGVYEEMVAGTQYRHYPQIWRVRVHQPR
jgi:hypothetical protein